MWKNLLFYHTFQEGSIVHQKEPRVEDFHDGFWPPPLDTTIPWERSLRLIKRPNTQKGQCYPAHPVQEVVLSELTIFNSHDISIVAVRNRRQICSTFIQTDVGPHNL